MESLASAAKSQIAAKTRAYLQRELAGLNDRKSADAEAASSSSSVASQEHASDEEAASSAYDSDASDLFHLQVEPAATWETPQDKDLRVAHLLAVQMRRHPFLPPAANDDTSSRSFIDVQSGLKLPVAHCAFKGCSWTGLTKNSIEEHVVTVHGEQLTAAAFAVYGDIPQYGSSPVFKKGLYALNMRKENHLMRGFFMGYYRQAIAEIERCAISIEESTGAKEMPNGHGANVCQGVPVVGPSVDRRTFGHLREVYNDDAIRSMICFVCAQRRTHTVHPNSAIQRRYLELFEARQTQRDVDKVLCIHSARQYVSNLCRKTFLHRFARQGTPLWNAKFLRPMEKDTLVTPIIGKPQPCEEDEDVEECWEWRRVYLASNGDLWDLLCCPEDVVCTAECRHANSDHIQADHIVCKNCLVPICDECYQYICHPPLYASPMALANDNIIGYTYETILQYKVSWIEAAAAQPAWTTMMCFYIEGDQGHLLEETMFESSFMSVVRGNVFSYHMPWEKIMTFLERTTSDDKLALLPHDPDHLAHMVLIYKLFCKHLEAKTQGTWIA